MKQKETCEVKMAGYFNTLKMAGYLSVFLCLVTPVAWAELVPYTLGGTTIMVDSSVLGYNSPLLAHLRKGMPFRRGGSEEKGGNQDGDGDSDAYNQNDQSLEYGESQNTGVALESPHESSQAGEQFSDAHLSNTQSTDDPFPNIQFSDGQPSDSQSSDIEISNTHFPGTQSSDSQVSDNQFSYIPSTDTQISDNLFTNGQLPDTQFPETQFSSTDFITTSDGTLKVNILGQNQPLTPNRLHNTFSGLPTPITLDEAAGIYLKQQGLPLRGQSNSSPLYYAVETPDFSDVSQKIHNIVTSLNPKLNDRAPSPAIAPSLASFSGQQPARPGDIPPTLTNTDGFTGVSVKHMVPQNPGAHDALITSGEDVNTMVSSVPDPALPLLLTDLTRTSITQDDSLSGSDAIPSFGDAAVQHTQQPLETSNTQKPGADIQESVTDIPVTRIQEPVTDPLELVFGTQEPVTEASVMRTEEPVTTPTDVQETNTKAQEHITTPVIIMKTVQEPVTVTTDPPQTPPSDINDTDGPKDNSTDSETKQKQQTNRNTPEEPVTDSSDSHQPLTDIDSKRDQGVSTESPVPDNESTTITEAVNDPSTVASNQGDIATLSDLVTASLSVEETLTTTPAPFPEVKFQELLLQKAEELQEDEKEESKWGAVEQQDQEALESAMADLIDSIFDPVPDQASTTTTLDPPTTITSEADSTTTTQDLATTIIPITTAETAIIVVREGETETPSHPVTDTYFPTGEVEATHEPQPSTKNTSSDPTPLSGAGGQSSNAASLSESESNVMDHLQTHRTPVAHSQTLDPSLLSDFPPTRHEPVGWVSPSYLYTHQLPPPMTLGEAAGVYIGDVKVYKGGLKKGEGHNAHATQSNLPQPESDDLDISFDLEKEDQNKHATQTDLTQPEDDKYDTRSDLPRPNNKYTTQTALHQPEDDKYATRSDPPRPEDDSLNTWFDRDPISIFDPLHNPRPDALLPGNDTQPGEVTEEIPSEVGGGGGEGEGGGEGIGTLRNPDTTTIPGYTSTTTDTPGDNTTDTDTPFPGAVLHSAQPSLFLKSSCQCGLRFSKKIVGGSPADVDQFPWMVGLLKASDQSAFCGGSIINDRFILTAAHCIYQYRNQPSALYVTVGETRREYERAQRVNVSRVIPHPKYSLDRVQEFDIGLLQLATPLTYNDRIYPVCLAVGKDKYAEEDAVVSGWGRNSFGGPLPQVLHEVTVRVMSNKNCRTGSSYQKAEVHKSIICARASGKDACQGDSGGPLVYLNNHNHYIQIGLVSWGIGCAQENYPGIYTRISSYSRWITKKTREGMACKGGMFRRRTGHMKKKNNPNKRVGTKDKTGGGAAGGVGVGVAVGGGGGGKRDHLSPSSLVSLFSLEGSSGEDSPGGGDTKKKNKVDGNRRKNNQQNDGSGEKDDQNDDNNKKNTSQENDSNSNKNRRKNNKNKNTGAENDDGSDDKRRKNNKQGGNRRKNNQKRKQGEGEESREDERDWSNIPEALEGIADILKKETAAD